MKIKLQPVHNSDLELILAWRSDPEIYKFFDKKQRKPLTWAEHYRFWNKAERNSSNYMICYINKYGNLRQIGLIRLVRLSNTYWVDITIGEKTLWGKGIGTKAVSKLLTQIRRKNRINSKQGGSKKLYKIIYAAVDSRNTASQTLFIKSGFYCKEVIEDKIIYSKKV